MQLKETEIILNRRGAIYHLDVLPEELADTIITVGDPNRVPIVSKYFDTIESKNQHREFVTHTGYINNKRISVLSTGIGTDNIDIVLNEIDFLKNYNFKNNHYNETLISCDIFRLGTCGSLQDFIPTDSMIVGQFGIGIDNLMHFYEKPHYNENKELLQKFIEHTKIHSIQVEPYIFSASDKLLSFFSDSKFFKGITVTTPGFYAPQGRNVRIPLAHKTFMQSLTDFNFKDLKILNFEMETSALYGLSKLLNHQCISLNVAVGNRVTNVFSKDTNTAINNLIQQGLEIISTI